MNAGLANLATLKAFLLPAALRSGTDDDATITAIGLGVAGLIEQACGRTLLRAAGVVDIFGADRAQFLLSRFPVEAVTEFALKSTEAAGFVVQTLATYPLAIDLANGIVTLGGDAGAYYEQLRVTYTGGYWWEVKEPTDNGYPTTQPAGSTALPAELRLAWLLQCQHVWASIDKLGTAIADQPGASSALDSLQLSPVVKQMLQDYERPNWT